MERSIELNQNLVPKNVTNLLPKYTPAIKKQLRKNDVVELKEKSRQSKNICK